MKATAKIIPIGNSRGVRVPKRMLDKLGLVHDVELEVRGHELVVRAAHDLHEGWEQSAEKLHQHLEDDLLFDSGPASDWDLEVWKW